MKVIYIKGHEKHTSNHIENADRIEKIKKFYNLKIWDKGDESLLELAHSKEYIEKIKNIKEFTYLDPDTYANQYTYEIAVKTVTACVESEGFILARPPGHHAHKNFGAGFCIFNNVAIASLYWKSQGKNVLVLDIDAHHGDGTQRILEGKIPFISLHKYGIYPGTGHFKEGGNKTFNIPLGNVNDEEYIFAFEKLVLPIINFFNPDIIYVSVGFDTYFKDFVGMELTKRSYNQIFYLLKNYKVVACLEGGYTIEGIKSGIDAFLNPKEEYFGDVGELYEKYINNLWNIFKKKLSLLK